ncbi:MAG: hypothetical protein CVU56_01505 [Deltaproteobacteria bacterium HGW-Deltaproteobacteria-14]|nr:MAG: hypothetical protein CVU56_01505 [Deltaproteobacteria bacterium HGW-Deltaproteobacteria-14]
MNAPTPPPLGRARHPHRAVSLGACALLGLTTLVTPAVAARSALGATITPHTLERVDGKGKAALFTKDAVTAVLLFTPDHAPSGEALDAAERCRADLAEAPVRWIALVSDRYPAADLRDTLARPGRTLDVAYDAGDAVYAELKAHVRPTAAIIDRDGRLVDWQPYESVGFGDKLCARVKHAAGLLDDAGRDAVLNPQRKTEERDPSAAKAQRYLKLGERLFAAGQLDKAEKMVRESLAAHEPVAAAHGLLGAILRARGDCPGALVAFERALALAPDDADAAAGRAACQKKKAGD